MPEAFWIAFFTSLPPLVAATAAAIIGIITAMRVEKVHKQINSRMDQLIEVTKSSSKAEGIKEEFDRVK